MQSFVQHCLGAEPEDEERGGEVRPELEPVHPSVLVAFGHLLMKYSASGCHPLHISGSQRTVVSQAVAVAHRSLEYIRDGFDAPMWMPREAGEVVSGIFITKVVKQQKWIEIRGVPEPKRATQLHACAFNGGLCLNDSFDWS